MSHAGFPLRMALTRRAKPDHSAEEASESESMVTFASRTSEDSDALSYMRFPIGRWPALSQKRMNTTRKTSVSAACSSLWRSSSSRRVMPRSLAHRCIPVASAGSASCRIVRSRRLWSSTPKLRASVRSAAKPPSAR